ncbi:hypothetical protein GCM10029978_055610 [Actinoallomurus acanthiterrae]
MPSSQIDPQAVKNAQRVNWDAISVGWETTLEAFERSAAAVTERLLALGGVRSGQSVLDVATGLGEPALTAARAVGRDGRVVGVDISPSMIEAARRRAGNIGNVEYRLGDVESVDLPDGSFDVVLSRWGLMFAVDHVAAFREMRRLLVPGGVLAASVWGPSETAPAMSLGYTVLSERLGLPAPPPGLPGPFSMSDPARLIDDAVAAGFAHMSVNEFDVPFRFGSVEEYVGFNQAVTPPLLLDRLRDVGDPDPWQQLAEAVGRYRSDDGGLSLPSTTLCLRAVAPKA